MNYYKIYLVATGELIARGTARECRKQLGWARLGSFYALADRSYEGSTGVTP